MPVTRDALPESQVVVSGTHNAPVGRQNIVPAGGKPGVRPPNDERAGGVVAPITRDLPVRPLANPRGAARALTRCQEIRQLP